MAKLYIIGNGFDIAHGLDTSYWSFRTFLEEKDCEFLLEFEKMYGIHYLDDTEYGHTQEMQEKWNNRVYNTLWSEFEKSMGCPDIQAMLDLSTSVLANMDLETGNVGILDTMDEYWSSQFGFIKKLQNYVKEWISQVDLSSVKVRKQLLVDNNEDYFINFNYTRVLEEIYQIDNILHIHGSIDKDADMPPFMGHRNQEKIDEHLQQYDEAYESGDEEEASIQNAIVEYLTAIYKDTSQYIRTNDYFFNRLKLIDEIIIIGWSAGNVDIPYLKKIRDSVEITTKWTVYYYDSKAYNALQKALSENSIIGCFQTEFIEANNFWD